MSFEVQVFDHEVELVLHDDHILVARIQFPLLLKDLLKDAGRGKSGNPDFGIFKYSQPAKPVHHIGIPHQYPGKSPAWSPQECQSCIS